MPVIDQSVFEGEIPAVTDHRNLPQNAAQLAKNVDLRGGKLQPLKVTNAFSAMHDTDTMLLKPGIPLSDIRSITKPAAPAESSRIRICVPNQWLSVSRRIWAGYLDDDGDYQESCIEYDSIVFFRIDYTDDGFHYIGYMPTEYHTFDTDRLYELRGPNYIVNVSADTGFYGGPSETLAYPYASTAHDPQIPEFSLAVKTPFPEDYDGYPTGPESDRYVYGYFSMTDVSGPVLPPTLYFDSDDYDGAATVSYKLHSQQYITVRFSLGYVDPKRKIYYYCQSMMDQRVAEGALTGALSGAITSVVLDSAVWGEDSDVPNTGHVLLDNGSDTPELVAYTAKNYVSGTGTWTLTVNDTLLYAYAEDDTATIIDPSITGIEGPPSELSDRIQVMPGEVLLMACARSNGYVSNRLYRTEDSTVDPRLVATVDADTYYDTGYVGLGDILPPFGNYPNATLADARARSVAHPMNFGAISYGKQLRLSDLYRLHAYPEEYAIDFLTDIMAHPVVGRSFIVFTQGDTDLSIPGYVYRVSGYRDQTSVDELTDARPLLNVLSMVKIDGSLFYVSSDGLMQVSEGGVQNVSTSWFSKQEWADLTPSLMKAYVNDSIIYLTVEDGTNLRLDLQRGGGALTRFTDLPTVRGTALMTWQGKIHQLPGQTRLRYARICAANYPVQLELLDSIGRVLCSKRISNDGRHCLPRTRTYQEVSYRVMSYYRVDRVTLADTPRMLDVTQAEG